VLILVEILHTVRISIRSHILLAGEPFLVVGLIASIRRILIISLEMASLTREATWSGKGRAPASKHESMSQPVRKKQMRKSSGFAFSWSKGWLELEDIPITRMPGKKRELADYDKVEVGMQNERFAATGSGEASIQYLL
jgi:hypothetical protein